jgi:hypothetical protein
MRSSSEPPRRTREPSYTSPEPCRDGSRVCRDDREPMCDASEPAREDFRTARNDTQVTPETSRVPHNASRPARDPSQVTHTAAQVPRYRKRYALGSAHRWSEATSRYTGIAVGAPPTESLRLIQSQRRSRHQRNLLTTNRQRITNSQKPSTFNFRNRPKFPSSAPLPQ